jgi:drug/metabolite transporter (DMT)-like permease
MGASVLLGLAAAFFYGATNFVLRFACRGSGVFRTMLYGQWLAIPFFTLALFFHGLPRAPFRIWALLALADILLLSATALVCRAFERGRLAIAAPIAASYGGVTALLAGLAGMRLAPAQWGAIFLVMAGSALVAARRGPRGSRESGALPAAGAALLFGVAYWLEATLVIPWTGTLATVWSYYLLGGLAMPLVAVSTRISIRPPSLSAFAWIAATTLFASAAYLTITAGLATDFPAIVAVLSALSSAVTVLLGQIILKENGTAKSWAGLATITAGLILLKA